MSGYELAGIEMKHGIERAALLKRLEEAQMQVSEWVREWGLFEAALGLPQANLPAIERLKRQTAAALGSVPHG